MDTVADMGGQQNYGSVRLDPPYDPPFHEEWERRAFAMALLSMRVSGTNLDAFRHALNRQHPIDYLAYGYYGRWLNWPRTCSSTARSSPPERSMPGPAGSGARTSRSRHRPSRTSPTTSRPPPARFARSTTRRSSQWATG